MNKSTAADIVLLEAVGDFVGDVKRLVNKVSNDGLFELIVRGLSKEVHLAGRTIGIKLNTFLVSKIIVCLRLYHIYSLLRQ